MKKRQVWAICDWGRIIKAGFATSGETYEYKVMHGLDGAICRVWI